LVRMYQDPQFGCGITTSSGVLCSGGAPVSSNRGIFGDGSDSVSSVAPRAPALAGNAVDVARSCAALADETVFCWGPNQSGQLGDGKTYPPKTPEGDKYSNVPVMVQLPPAGGAVVPRVQL